MDELFMAFREEEKEFLVKVSSPVEPNEQGDRVLASIAIDLQFDASSLRDALGQSFKIANSVASVLSLLTSTGFPPVSLKLAFDWSEDRTEHDFIQVADLSSIHGVERPLREADFMQLVAGINSLGVERSRHVFRAMRWYSHANQQRNYLFRLLAYWFALEALEPLLVKHPASPAKRERKKRGPKTPGIASFMATEAGADPGLYDRIRRLRNDVVHGSKTLGLLEDEARRLCSSFASVPVAAIAHVASWKPPLSKPLFPALAGTGRKLSLRTRVRAEQPGYFGVEDELPHFDERLLREVASKIGDRGFTMVSDAKVLGPRMAQGVSFGAAVLTVHGSELDWADIDITFLGQGLPDSESSAERSWNLE